MKLSAIIFLALISFTSCHKGGDDDAAAIAAANAAAAQAAAAAANTQRSFTCTINGTPFTADSAWYNNFNAGGTNIFAVKGTGATEQRFEINLTGQTAASYSFPPHSFTYQTSTNTYAGTSGTLTITTYDMVNKKISGNFTSITAGAVTISSGSFANLPYK